MDVYKYTLSCIFDQHVPVERDPDSARDGTQQEHEQKPHTGSVRDAAAALLVRGHVAVQVLLELRPSDVVLRVVLVYTRRIITSYNTLEADHIAILRLPTKTLFQLLAKNICFAFLLLFW